MPAPNIVSVSPNPNAVGVVLGQPISIVFDSLIDHTTLSSASISVSYPAGNDLITPESYIAQTPATQTGIALVQGTYTATDSTTATTLVFSPSVPFQPNTQYTVFVLGADAQFSTAEAQDTGYPDPAEAKEPHARAQAAVPAGSKSGASGLPGGWAKGRAGDRFRRPGREPNIYRFSFWDPWIVLRKNRLRRGQTGWVRPCLGQLRDTFTLLSPSLLRRIV